MRGARVRRRCTSGGEAGQMHGGLGWFRMCHMVQGVKASMGLDSTTCTKS